MAPGQVTPRLRAALLALFVLSGAMAGCVKPSVVVNPTLPYITVEQDAAGGARVFWEENPKGVATFFRVYRDGREIARVDSPSRNHLDATVVADRPYVYQIISYGRDEASLAKSPQATFTFRQSLSLVQDARVGRGYANLTVVEASPGLRWDDLQVYLDRKALPLALSGLLSENSWAHTAANDSLVDRGEKLSLLSPFARNNASLQVRLGSGKVLHDAFLLGRPTINLTVKQERNATAGRATLTVLDVAFTEDLRKVTPADASIVARWSALTVRVNGTAVRLDEILSDRAWTHESPNDDVVRVGERITVRYDRLLGPTTVVTVEDAEALGEAVRVVLR